MSARRRRARAHRRRARRGAAAARGCRRRACRGREPRRARRAARALERRREAARPGEPAREGGVRGREGAPRGAVGQREDLEQSLAELEKLRDDLTETVETRFAETFAAVEHHFHEVAATPVPRRRGPPAADRARGRRRRGARHRGRAAPGRQARHAAVAALRRREGARRDRVPLRLFLARPSPFYLLDEVEAALDDTNIGRFTELLRQYADRAQFIVITHQKRTMEAADVLYGVTMGADGVSQIVSRRLPQEENTAVSA